MAKMVGLSRNLKEPWLDKVAELAIDYPNEDEIKEILHEYLSFEIKSETNLRKTREILLNIWVKENGKSVLLRETAIEIFRSNKKYKLVAHWCLMMAAYPVFSDLTRLMGKFEEFQDGFSLKQLKNKIFDEWGERTTLFHSIDKIIATLKAIGVLEAEKPGQYRINKLNVDDVDVVKFMVYTGMLVDEKNYYDIDSLNNLPSMFPFNYSIDINTLTMDDRFAVNNFGGNLTIALN